MRKFVCATAIMLAMLGVRAAEEGQPRQGRQNFDPEQFRQRMMDRLKETLAPTDDEWKVLQPKIEAVQKIQMQSRGGSGFGGGRRGGQGGQGGAAAATPAPETAAAAQPKSDVETKSQALRTLLENKEADPKVVAEKVKDYREAREKVKADLKKAQDALREIVTPRQEAQLLLMGMLE